MKTMKQLLTAALITTASAAASADLDLYLGSTFPGEVTASVYMDGNPVEGATVTLSSNDGIYTREMVTGADGRADFYNTISYGLITVTAEKESEKSNTRTKFIHADHER